MFLAPDPISFAIALVVLACFAFVGLSRGSKVNSLLLTIVATAITVGNWIAVTTQLDLHGLTVLQYISLHLWWVAILGFISGGSIGLWFGLGRNSATEPTTAQPTA